jgi:hypothetical protein
MPADLRDVTREFGRGQTTLENLREAARAEPRDRQLAGALLQLIAEWESTAVTVSVRSRSELRARIRQLVPPDPPASPEASARRDPAESIYAAGLRGQRRRRS